MQLARLRYTVLVVALLVACAPKGVIVEPDAQADFRRLQIVRIINDVDTAVIAANRNNNLTDPDTAAVLRVTWQARDYVERNPLTTGQRVIAVLQEGQDALPADLRARVSSFLAVAIAALQEIQR